MNESVDLIALDEPRDGIPGVTHEEIDEVTAALAAGHGPFSVDTERAMGIRYSDRAYLVQVRREGAGTFLIDPVGIEHRLGPLAEVMSTDQWILHAADQDLPCLHELGLYPPEIFDTEIAGLLLGFPRISLQSEVAEVLGFGLAKEHSNSDWSERPLAPALLAYAALDVELLLELRDELTAMLERAGRLEWLREECEEIRLRGPRPPKVQPWRKAARQAGVKDQRSLGMLEALWVKRDELARQRDLAPEKVLPSKVMGQLALRKPRSRQDVENSPLLRSRSRRRDALAYWQAVEPVWRLEAEELPSRQFKSDPSPFPPVKQWQRYGEDVAERWNIVRGAVLTRADDLGIRQELLLKPLLQKHLAWDGWDNPEEIPVLLAALGARPWQVENVAPAIVNGARRATK